MSLTMVSVYVGKGDDVPFGDDVMHAHEGGVIVVGNDGEWVGAYGGYLFDGFSFHIAVTNCRARRGRSNAVLPFWVGHEETAKCRGHHGAAVEHGVRVIG